MQSNVRKIAFLLTFAAKHMSFYPFQNLHDISSGNIKIRFSLMI